MLTFVKDEFDENSDDILNSINKMLENNRKEKNEEKKNAENREDNSKKWVIQN